MKETWCAGRFSIEREGVFARDPEFTREWTVKSYTWYA